MKGDEKYSVHCRISNQCTSTYKPSAYQATKNNTHVGDTSIDNIKHCCRLRRYALKPLISLPLTVDSIMTRGL